MTIADLRKLSTERGLTIAGTMRKEGLIHAIQASEKAPPCFCPHSAGL
jgi:hypothetical protein